MKDTSYWAVSGLIVLFLVILGLQHRDFVSGNTFGNARFQDEVIPRQTEVPEITRKFIGVEVENSTQFLELRVGKYVRNSTGTVSTIVLIAFLFLGIRQRRLMVRLRELEQR